MANYKKIIVKTDIAKEKLKFAGRHPSQTKISDYKKTKKK